MRELTFGRGRRIAVSADLHVYERRIIAYCKRPWLYFDTENRLREERGEPYRISDAAAAAHDKALVDNINGTIGPEDVLFIVGDVCAIGQAQQLRASLLVDEVYIVVGNHDNEDELRSVFGHDRVFERVKIAVDGPGGVRRAVLDHYPCTSWDGHGRGDALCFGHSHQAMNNIRASDPALTMSLDVGVDGHDFRPWKWGEELVPYFDKRREEFGVWKKANLQRIPVI